MSESNKRKRKEENCFDQSATAERLSENKLIASGAGFSANTDQNQTYNIQQTIFLNQLPVVPNQQLVYQVEGVQNLNNLNFGTNGNGQQNLVYIVIPGANANESVQLENLPLEVLKKEKDGNGQGIEFIRLDDEKRVGPTDGLVRDADIKRDKLYLNNAAVQLAPSCETSQQSPQTEVPIAVHKPEGVYVVEDQQLNYSTTTETNTTNTSSKNILRTHGYKCDYPPCTMAFSSIYEKKAHMDVHLFPESTEFKCNICNQVFSKAIDRNKHVESHAVVSTFKCRNCKQAFPYYTSLVKHIDENRCVQKNKLHVCYFCGSKFVNHVDLEKHHEANLKMCSCKAKICGEQSFEVHTNLCSAYKNKVNKCRKKLKTNESVVVLD